MTDQFRFRPITHQHIVHYPLVGKMEIALIRQDDFETIIVVGGAESRVIVITDDDDDGMRGIRAHVTYLNGVTEEITL